MNQSFGRSSAAPLFTGALTMRMFIGLAIEHPGALNAAWMCPLVGLIISLPFAFVLQQEAVQGGQSPWNKLSSLLPAQINILSAMLFCFLLLIDAASVLRLTASSSNIIALYDATVHVLVLPAGIAAGIAAYFGPQIMGNSTRIALRMLPAFLIIVLIVQLGSYEVGWLTPVLGGGIREILSGGIYCAGCMALLMLIWIPAQPDRNQHGILRYIICASAGAAALMAALHMSYPIMPESSFTQAARIELILSNGRMSLSPQFILNILWFGGLLYLLAAELSAAVFWFRKAFHRFNALPASILCALAISLAAIFNPAWLQNSSALIYCMYALLSGIFMLQIFVFIVVKRGKRA